MIHQEEGMMTRQKINFSKNNKHKGLEVISRHCLIANIYWKQYVKLIAEKEQCF